MTYRKRNFFLIIDSEFQVKFNRGLAGWLVGNCDFNENPVVRLDLDFDLRFVKSKKKMQNIDETPPVISPTAILKRPPFLFFEVESWFWCEPCFG